MSHQRLKRRSDIHLARKVWHFSGVMFITIWYHNLDHSTAIYIISLATSIFVMVDLLRLQLPKMNNGILSILHPFMRESERNGIAGTTHLLVGVTVLITFFPKPVVELALLFLATADPLASYAGILYGRDKIWGKKSLQGTFAAFVCCCLVSVTYFFIHSMMLERLLVVSVLGGIVGAVSELIQVGKMDDNFSFPLICALGLWGLLYLFGGF